MSKALHNEFIHVIYCEEVPVFSSKLEVIMYGDYGDVEFQMKKIDFNITPEINPTSTIPIVEDELKVNLEQNFTNNINNNNNTLVRKDVPDKDSTVPIMAALYFYDKNVVEELRSFLKKENKNISQTHKSVIEKYVTEWDDVIHDPDTQEFYQDINHPFPELKTPFFNLPKEIEHMFKLMRMSARVYIELNRIINMLREFTGKI
ncbi:hypothetical protein Avbf_15672 [Armadillidium vulgare]|nr:hypothetical protein Avbf_15672 [Armadillidium vulgare]